MVNLILIQNKQQKHLYSFKSSNGTSFTSRPLKLYKIHKRFNSVGWVSPGSYSLPYPKDSITQSRRAQFEQPSPTSKKSKLHTTSLLEYRLNLLLFRSRQNGKVSRNENLKTTVEFTFFVNNARRTYVEPNNVFHVALNKSAIDAEAATANIVTCYHRTPFLFLVN